MTIYLDDLPHLLDREPPLAADFLRCRVPNPQISASEASATSVRMDSFVSAVILPEAEFVIIA